MLKPRAKFDPDAAGGLGLCVLTGCWVFTRSVAGWEPLHLHERAVFYFSIVSLLLGAQVMSAGVLAEMITAQRNRDEAFYSISQTTGLDEPLEDA